MENNNFGELIPPILPLPVHLTGRSYDNFKHSTPKPMRRCGNPRHVKKGNRSPSSPSLMSNSTLMEDLFSIRGDGPYYKSTPGEPIKVTIYGTKKKKTSNKRFSANTIDTERSYCTRTPASEYGNDQAATIFCTPIYQRIFPRSAVAGLYSAHVTNIKMVRNILNNIVTIIPVILQERKFNAISKTTYCSFSTQTEHSPVCDNAWEKINKAGVKDDGETEEIVDWLDDARELRDSHVQLVQQQLRHIKRLNRALDRALGLHYTAALKSRLN